MGVSSLEFGTSGLRGLASELVGAAARKYAAAFLAHLQGQGLAGAGRVFVGRDLRASSAPISADCAAAIRHSGFEPVDCGVIATPALAHHAMAEVAPAIMVTGSHIPADRNGLKFYTPNGEISKADEAGITARLAHVEAAEGGVSLVPCASPQAWARYRERYAGLLPEGALRGWRIGVFEHSSVLRDVLGEILQSFGAEIVSLGRSETFVAVDTEAFGDTVFAPLAGWLRQHRLDAIVSADGDGDRPLLMDAAGSFVRGDVLGLLTARLLAADVVVMPVTANSAIEALTPRVSRTRVGSPYVIAGMEDAAAAGAKRVVGFEPNGGVLLGSDIDLDGHLLKALPTRDGVLPLLAAFGLAAASGIGIAELVARLPLRAAGSARLQNVPRARSTALFEHLAQNAEAFFAPQDTIADRSAIDGLRFTLQSGDVVHYRASGNAPELRCYAEALNEGRVKDLLAWALAAAERHVRD